MSDSSSSATARPEGRQVDLLAEGFLPPLPAAFLGGRDLDLLAPLSFLAGEAPPAAVDRAPVERSELAAALESANAGYGHPAAAELGRRLADPATEVVVTGQQPGLFGGPLYTLSKALAATRWAERMTAAGRPAVAVFWVATEDHDYREVSRATFFAADGGLSTVDLGREDPAPLLPVGMRTLGAGVEAALAALGQAQPGERFGEWIETLRSWYRPDARFGEAFCRLLAHLMGERCPLLLDAMLPAVKRAEAPWMCLLVERRVELANATAEREAEIARRGYDLQVRPQRRASPLFLLHGRERRRIAWRDDGGYELRGTDGPAGTVDSLLATLDENPGVVSPGVLARPAIQDAILGTTLLLLGPGELSYLPQVAPVYELFGITPPAAALRPQMLVLEGHQLAKLETSGIDLARLVAPELDLERLLAGGEAAELLATAKQHAAGLAAELERAAGGVDDAGLAGPLKKTRDQIDRALGLFEGKLGAALARRQEVARQRAVKLRALCRPGGQAQERAIATAHYPGRHGRRFVDAALDQLALDPANLQVVSP